MIAKNRTDTIVNKSEKIKRSSNYLRASLSQQLDEESQAFQGDSLQVLPHHGIYQQIDRDIRAPATPRKDSLVKVPSLMVRTRLPGGKLTSKQLLIELALCDELANGTLRITDRQAFQLYGIPKRNVRETIRRINEAQMTTLGASGDVERNVLCCPAPFKRNRIHDQMQRTADRLSTHLLPRTTAYHEIWLSDSDSGQRELVGGGVNGHGIEPIYGETYLPRKFKTAIALPHDNCIDIYSNDLGFLVICEKENLIGYNVLVGGGFGVSPSNKKTFPAVAKKFCFSEPDEVIDLATAIIKVQRDYGNRANRKRARMKYLLADWGMEKFKARVQEYYGRPLHAPHPEDVWGFDDHLGWHEQGDGRWFYGLNIENGRIADRDGWTLKTALREICNQYAPGIRLTGQQSILFTDIHSVDRFGLETILEKNGVQRSEAISTVRRWSMACVALPTCSLAITESERVLPGLMDRFEMELARLGLTNERFLTRMTGCPNGCARPYNADIGLVGRGKGTYAVHLGGRVLGDRLAVLYQDLVPLNEIVPTLLPVLTYFKHQRSEGETFGDFCYRRGVEDIRTWVEEFMPLGGSAS